jgi:hypothetical protein
MKTSIRLTIATLGIVLGTIPAAHATDDDMYRGMTQAPSKAVEKSGKPAQGTILDDPHYQEMTQGTTAKKEGKSSSGAKTILDERWYLEATGQICQC